jgi:hypothetical protein
MCGCFLLVGCVVVSVHKCFCHICKHEHYSLTKAERKHKKQVDDEAGDIFEMRPMLSPSPPPPPRRGTKVMITNETGHIPSYTLRSRGDDGSVRYKTRYNPELGCMETEL